MKKKSRILIYPLIIMGLILMLTNSCKKKEEAPSLTTSAVSAITVTTATSGGNITSDGGAAITARGVCWSTGATPTTADSKTTDGTGAGSFTSAITGLTTETTYYVRAFATNSAGTGYGSAVSFTTLAAGEPVLTTSAVSNIADITATCGGNITSDGGSAVTARGVCWSTGATPTTADSKTTDGTGTGSFTSAITGLTAETTYNVRAYATNSTGTGYGTAVPFTTSGTPITDFDGNVYQAVTIGTQVWMVGDLKTTHYNNGDPIPNITDAAEWAALSTPGYCWYDNDDVTYKPDYGAIYNWYTVNTGNLSPTGWHVPTDAEWTTLTEFLGGDTVAGGPLKEIGLTHWADINTGATNETGFTAVGGGFRNNDGTFMDIGASVNWWSSTDGLDDSGNEVGVMRAVSNGYIGVWIGAFNKKDGFFVRCIKDAPAK